MGGRRREMGGISSEIGGKTGRASIQRRNLLPLAVAATNHSADPFFCLFFAPRNNKMLF